MNKPTNSPNHYSHGSKQRRNDTLITAVQALFGGSVVYRLFAHFMKDPEFEQQVMRLVPKDKLPLIAAGTVAAGAVGLIGQRRISQSAEKELGHALDEMTDEAKDLRAENERLRGRTTEVSRPSNKVHEVVHRDPIRANKMEHSK